MEFFSFDDAYLERLRSGDFRTEQHFVSYFSQLIQLKLRSRVQSLEVVEDLRQEIFVRVFATLRGTKGLRQADRLGAFVNSVCNNVLLEHYRASSRTSSIEDENEQVDIPDHGIDALSGIMAQQTAAYVQATLDDLSERDRRLLKEVFIEERDKDEVCREFGVDRGYLRVLLHRARQTFKSHFQQEATGKRAGNLVRRARG
ncbi:MAG: sigma-70 family RNA polymerase sigma factor [Acidobacteria bacterium]|nr:sigma-70 family RNA polymerase sigma factor [Acidobacteriota bacterium]